MEALRVRIIAQAKKYFGVPYKRKYWDATTPEYQSPIFLDCCGLVRQVIRDLEPELGFRLGPWNQAYMYDTLPVTLKKEQMKPGDLVFMRGIYTGTRTKKQRHNMTHVEIWLGEGDKTIGSRWNKGKVGEFQSYMFSPKSFHSEEYIFKSIDTWLMGICHSYCSKHPWRVSKYNPTCKSIFNVAKDKNKDVKDEKAEPDTEDEGVDDGDDDDEGSILVKVGEDNQVDTESNNWGGGVGDRVCDNKGKDKNGRSQSIGLDAEVVSLSMNKKGGVKTPESEAGGLTPRSRASKSPRSNPRTPRFKSNNKNVITKRVKPAQDAYVIETDVIKTGPAPNAPASVSKFKKQDLVRMAAHALKRRNNEAKEEDSSETVTPTPIPIVGNCNCDELKYIPANMPSRMNSSSSSSQWVPTKDRERRVQKEMQSAFIHPNQRTASWNLHHSERNPNFSVIGSRDASMPTVSSCPNLQQSDVNLLFRANTSFFDAGQGKCGSNKASLIAVNRKREIVGSSRTTKQSDNASNKERHTGSLDIILAKRGNEHSVEDCLLVRRSPSFAKDIEKPKDDHRGTGESCQTASPIIATSVLQDIQKRHSVKHPRQEGNCSQIQEESLVAETDGSERQSFQNSDVKLREKQFVTDKNDDVQQDVPFGSERGMCIDDNAMEGRESALKCVEEELKALSFSQEVIQDTARSLSELENADDCNTSLCSDFEFEENENEKWMNRSNNHSTTSDARIRTCKENADNCNNNCPDNQCCSLSGSDENTDDEFQSAVEMTVLNHRALGASTAIFVGDGNRHNHAWEWLHALKAGELINDSPDLDTNNYNNINGYHVEQCLTRDGGDAYDKFLDNNIRQGRLTPSFADRKFNTLPPINTKVDGSNPNNLPQINTQVDGSNPPASTSVFQDRDDQDACSMAVMLPMTRQTGIRPSLQAANTFFDQGFHTKSRANNLLAHYVLSQHPNVAGDPTSSEGVNASFDDSSYCHNPNADSPENRHVLTTPSTFESSASCHSLSSENLVSLQQMISRQQNPFVDDRDTQVMTSQNPTRFYIGTPGASAQEGDENVGDDIVQESTSETTHGRLRAAGDGSSDQAIRYAGKRPSTTGNDKAKADSNTTSDPKDPSTPPVGSHGKAGKECAPAKSAKGGDGRGRSGDDAPKGRQPTAGSAGAGDGASLRNSGSAGGGGGGGGSGGGGGGNRKPVGGRPSKLPACSLPNNMQPTFYIGGGNGTALVEAPLLNLGWKRITDKYDERFRLKWVECKSKINYAAFKEGEQLVNHIPNCKLLTNKLGLLSSLQEYERVTLLTKGRFPRMKMADFVPETYKLDERNDREKFLNEYKDGEVWICKPTGLNQGKGIFLLRTRAEIDQLLVDRDAKNQSKTGSRPPMMRIVQRYIKNPLLLDGRKFDIRAYMLIASTVPYLVLYSKGYVRLSVIKYDNEDTNLTAHLTNQYIQKKDPSYKDVKEDSAWTMDKFNEYINDNFAADHGLEKDWVYGTLTKQMQRIILHCFNGVKHKLQCKIGYFDLYGMDFMVDTDFKIWLIEINVNPALHINCEALKDIIPDVVEESLHVSIEAFDKSRKGQPLMPLNSLRSFSVLYCGTSPNTVAPRQTRSVSPSKDGVEKNRPSGTAPSARRASPPRNLPRMSIANTQMTSGQSASSGPGNNSQPSPYASKRVSVSSTLPTINIGATVIQKKGSGGGGVASSTNNSTDTKHQQSQSQQPKQQQQTQQPAKAQPPEKQPPTQPKYVPPQPQVQDIGSALGEDQQTKLRMTHADSDKRKSRDYSSRGN